MPRAIVPQVRRTALFLVFVLLVGVAPALAKTVTVAWDPNPPEENVTGYVLHYGTTSRSAPGFTAYDSQMDVHGVTEYSIDLADGATYYIAVTAYNAAGLTSDYSVEITSVPDGATHLIVASSEGDGAIAPSGSITLAEGESQTFTVTPDAGALVADVVVDGTSVGAVSTYTFSNVTADHTIAASFALDSFTVTASAGANGTISPSGSVTVSRGGSRTFAIAPATGYHVADVRVDGTSVGAVSSYTFSNVTSNHTIAASFALDSFTVTASAGANGAISPSGSAAVSRGGSRTFAIAPAAGYRVADVVVDGTSVGAVSTYTFNDVTVDHTIAVSFAADGFTVTVNPGSHGTVEPSGAVSVARGEDLTLTLTPNFPYRVADLRIDGVSVGAVESYTLVDVTSNHTVEAVFEHDRPSTPHGPKVIRLIVGSN